MLGAHAIAAEIPLCERKSSYDLMTADTRAMQDDDTSNPAMLWVLDGEALWNRRPEARRQIMRRLSWRCAHEHGRRRGTISRIGQSARTAGRSGAAHQYLSRREAESDALAVRKQGAARAYRLYRHAVARHADRKQKPDEPSNHFFRQAATCSICDKASSTSPAAQCHDDIGEKSSPARPSRKGIRTATRFTAWNGKPWDRCNAGCAIASPACAPSLMPRRAEYVNLEVYLMWRARGMTIETPAVRP